MARQPVTSNLNSAALYIINNNGTLATNIPQAQFLLNPENYNDSKANVGWVGNVVPGQSLPVYQWTAGGPRVISFEALVTKDTSYFNRIDGKAASDLAGSLLNKGLTAVGSIASNFLGVPIPSGQLLALLNGSNKNNGRFNYDISDLLDYYRSMYAPTYDGSKIIQSPPLLYLFNGIDEATSEIPSTIDSTSEVFILTNLDIKITKQLPDLTPMEAMVSFQLEQYPLTSVGLQSDGT